MKLNKLFITSLLSSLLLLLASSWVASQSELLSTYLSVMDVNDISSIDLRNSQSHKLDSIFTLGSHKTFYKFEKKSLSFFSLRYCDTSQTYSIPGIYSRYEFNEDDQIVYDAFSALPPSIDVNELTFESLEDYPPTSHWNYTYDLESRLIKSERKTIGIELNCILDSLVYDLSGNLSEVLTYFPSAGGLELMQRKFYSHIDNKLNYAIDIHLDDGEWVNKDSLHFSYNFSGLIDTLEVYFWRATSNSFIPSEVETYEYDVNERLLSSFSYYGFGVDGEWNNIEKASYDFDDRGDLKEYYTVYLKRMGFDYSGDDMPPLRFQVLYEHNHSVPFEDILFPNSPVRPAYWPIGSRGTTKLVVNGSNHNSMVVGELEFNETATIDKTYYYSEINPNSLNEPEIETLNISPNPVTDLLTIENTLSNRELIMEIYSHNGALVFTTPYHNSKSVDLSHLTSGLYYINLISDGKVWTGSFVKI